MLSKEERETLLKLARDTITARLTGNQAPPFSPNTENLKQPRGAFVTLHKRGSLRGCIGYVEPIKPLYQTVKDMALAAAFQDPRFPPVSPGELDELEIEISVMSPVEKITDVSEIEVGKHGIIIKKGYRQGLFLSIPAIKQVWQAIAGENLTLRYISSPLRFFQKKIIKRSYKGTNSRSYSFYCLTIFERVNFIKQTFLFIFISIRVSKVISDNRW